MHRKTLHFYAPNTATAQRLKFPRGCYTVEVRSLGQPLTIVAAYADHGEALQHFDRVNHLPCPYHLAVNRSRGARKGPAWLNE